MKIWNDYYKVLDVIDSCTSVVQLISASKMLAFWYDKHLDYQVYTNTFRFKVKSKFTELGGTDSDLLIFRMCDE